MTKKENYINKQYFIILMAIIYNYGDLITTSKDDAIAHGCNTMGVMGVGAALALKNFYDAPMYADYVHRSKNGLFLPGDILKYQEDNKPILYNLGIQTKPGKFAKIDYIKKSLYNLIEQANKDKITSLSITPLGTVNGGLNIDEVIDTMTNSLQDANFDITIYHRKDQDSIPKITKSWDVL